MTITHKTPYGDFNLSLQFATYTNGQTAIKLIDTEDGCPFATATVSVDDQLLEDEVAIKNYSENEGILDSLINAGIIEKPHEFINSGFVTIPVCKLLISK
jgi:hypothetical protein